MRWLSDNALDRLRRDAAFPDLEGTKYHPERFIASGGMGEVYLVRDTALDRNVAMKVLNGVLSDAGNLAERMLREARVIARLEHPGIVPVHDVGHLADGRVFFTMKYVQGQRLDHHVGADVELPDRLRLMHRVCEAVAFAHAHGVLHRDLKPENVMVGLFGEVLVMDWGIAKVLAGRVGTGSPGTYDAPSLHEHLAVEAAGFPATGLPATEASSPEPLNDDVPETGGHLNGHHTAEGLVLGTPCYMAPEQARGRHDAVDERSDVYALGGILFFLLTGAPPPAGEDAAARLAALARVPRPLREICMKAMAADPAHRYAGAGELGDDVLRYLDGSSVRAYREPVSERSLRFLKKYAFIVVLVVAYLIMRAVVFFALDR